MNVASSSARSSAGPSGVVGVHQGNEPPRPETLTSFLESVVSLRPQAPAILYGGRSLSWAEFLSLTQRTATGLAARGLTAGDRLALWLPTLPEYLILSFAAWRLGAAVVSVNTRFNTSELSHILRSEQPKMLAFWPGFVDIDFAAILADVPPEAVGSLTRLLVYREGCASDFTAHPALTGIPVDEISTLAHAPPLIEDRATPESPCVIFTTSGTTSLPKFVLHLHRGAAQHGRDVARRLGFDAHDAVTLQALPLCAVFGFAQALGAIAGGGPQICMPRFDAARAAALVRKCQVTHCMGTDELLARMLAAVSDERPFPSLRICGFVIFNPSMSGFLDEATRRGLPLAGVFGMSEVLALFAVQRPEDPPERRLRGGGFPVSPHAAARVRDIETGALLPHGATGLLEVRGPSVMAGYDGNEEATGKAFTEDGFLRTGDLAYTREDGSFIYVSRHGDALRLSGFLVSPAEIEAYLERHPAVRGVQVVGALMANRPCAVAFVLLHEGAAADENTLRAYCQASLARYKVPERIIPLDEFPVTRSGNGTKIQRHKLRAMAQELFPDDAPR